MYFSNLLIFSAHLDDRKKKEKLKKKLCLSQDVLRERLETSYGVEVEESDQRLEW